MRFKQFSSGVRVNSVTEAEGYIPQFAWHYYLKVLASGE